MGVGKATFASGGKISQHVIPGAYSRNVSLPSALGSVSTGRIAILGSCFGGKPGELLTFTNPGDARTDLKQGALLEAVLKTFNPGNDFIPQEVNVVRVDPALQSSATLKKSAVDKIVLKTKDYGALTVQTQYKLINGSTSGKLFAENFQGQEFEIDNIKRESFSVQYIGAGSACTMTISATAVTTAVTGGGGGEDLNILFSSYGSMADVVAFLNSQAGYTATIASGQSASNSAELDVVSAVDIQTTIVTVNSDTQALIDAINGSNYWEAELKAGATREVPDNVSTFTFGAGGTNGVVSNTEWTNALLYLEGEDIQLLGGTTLDSSIHALFQAHIVQTNSVEGKAGRQAYIGGGVDLATSKTQAIAMNNQAINVCYSPFNGYDVDGVEVEFDSSYFACMQMGQVSAVDLNIPTTYKALSVISLTDELTKAEKEDAIQSGLLVAETTPQGVVRTVRSITSYQGDDIKFNEASAVRQILFMDRDIRTGAETLFIGSKGDTGVFTDIDQYLLTKLVEYREAGYLVGDASNPAFRDNTLKVIGDKVYLEWTGNVSLPINFVFITNNFSIFVS